MRRKDVAVLKRNRDIIGLIRALDDPDEFVRADAALALGSVGDARAIEPLNHAKFFDVDGNVRRIAGIAQMWVIARLEQEKEAGGR
ncbi:MAG: HEAT repeat domain-containing protein [Methanomicrobiaceae archaeon]|uniref:HEAT repeat domain-containing protein n=1 Tax=hydrocarbon metagenome TaxID=938273 RepID=A0A0W8FK75_9ZZZZ|nr:HEAT repeat domain-containing protein [Methanomicrobiaceae archaeon]MDD5419323.1 HEAT repeat domain-containing protein [Methanomicrobiaceae archaeon]